jgi:hypothetical protein
MKKLILIFAILFSGIFCNAQTTVTDNLSSRYIFKTDNQFIICGYIINGAVATFKATLYDKNLKVLKEYKKDIPANREGMMYPQLYGNVLIVRTGWKSNAYFINLTTNLEEISFCEKTPEIVNNNVNDKDHVGLANYQFELEGDAYGMGYAGGNRRRNEITHHRFLNNDVLDFDIKSGLLTRYNINDKPKFYPTYKPMWSSEVARGENLKLTGFEYVDEEEIMGSFIVKKENVWKDYVCKFDAKTGEVIFFKEATYPDANEVFSISNAYYNKKNKNFIVVGQLLLMKKGKDVIHAVGILVYDSKGNLINSKKIEFEQLTIKGSDLETSYMVDKEIGQLSNGNYFLVFEHGSLGYSYFELNKELDIIANSGLKESDWFAKGVASSHYCGFNIDTKKVVYSVTDKLSKNVYAINLSPKNQGENILRIGTTVYDVKKTEGMSDKKMNIYQSFVVGDHAIIFNKQSGQEEFTLTSVSLKY